MQNPEPSAGVSPAAPARARPLLDRRGNLYQPAIGPRLKVLLALVFASFAVLGATGAYLIVVRLVNWLRAPQSVTNSFTIWMFLVHVAVGFAIALPFLFFGFTHYATARHRKNRPAVRLGVALFVTGIIVLLTGLALNQLPALPKLPTDSLVRVVTFWLHVLAPVAAVVLYVLHRRAGPDIKWSWGIAWGGAVGAFVVFMVVMHAQDPRRWYAVGPKEGVEYFQPSEVRTVGGNFIPAKAFMMDEYCLKCHADIYQDHYHSAHKFSSFNNPAYLFSVRKTREMGLKRDSHVKASRWCAGCHDVVPFLSGAFDNPDYDDVKDPTAHAGITCTVCHAITNVNSPMGNAAYTIEEPLHYPFAYSDNEFLQWVNNQLVKAKPDFHKQTMLKPFHKSAEFCSTCHKVSLPLALNDYKEFLRGQNHYDTYLLSGVSGVGARSFYYPPKAKTNCAECHMPLKESADFGSKDFDGSGRRTVHNHGFIGANTGLFALLAREANAKGDPKLLEKAAQAHADFLRGTQPDGSDKKVRIDLFGIKEGRTPAEDGTIRGRLIAPLRPELPALKPGRTYLVEVVVRTVNLGHPFPQGTADSNEIWVNFEARAGKRLLGQSGALQGKEPDTGPVDPWAHFINIFMLDRTGKRINRRNPEDIVVPLYDHQIPPGAGQVVHYKLAVPADVTEPVRLKVRLRYRKFDYEYMSLVYGDVRTPKQRPGGDRVPRLPIVDMCADEVTLPVEGMANAEAILTKLKEQKSPIKPAWQRWNDYGIGCFLEGAPGGAKAPGMKQEGELDQAERAFAHLARAKEFAGDPAARGNGLINLARVYNDMGQLKKAVAVLKEVNALNRAHRDKPPVPWWTVAWVAGQVDLRNQHWDAAVRQFETILDPDNQPRERNFDFTRDYLVINALGKTLFGRAQDRSLSAAARTRLLNRAVEQYERTLTIDPENVDAHIALSRCYHWLGEGTPTVNAREVPAGTEETLNSLAKLLADTGATRARRLQAAEHLEDAVRKFGRQPTKPNRPKIPVLAAVRKQCRQVFADEKDPGLRAAAALVLGKIHGLMHGIYKPDDNAREIIELFRTKPGNEAASHASQPVVIYPLANK